MAKKTAKSTNIRPLYDRILIKPEDAEERTTGGIYLPDTAKEKPMRGEVVALGIGKVLDSGKLVEPTVKVGDKVLFGKYSGTEVKVEGVEYTIVRESELLGILD
jgi:chaperonin GroES